MKTKTDKKLLKAIRTGIRLKLRAPKVIRDGKQYRRRPKHRAEWNDGR